MSYITKQDNSNTYFIAVFVRKKFSTAKCNYFFLILKLSFQLITSKHKNAEKINSYFEIIREPQKDFFLKITTVFR